MSEIIQPPSLAPYLEQLVELLLDSVNHGASIGFIAPLSSEQARGYWRALEPEVVAGHRKILLAVNAQKLVGSVQLALCTKMNALHRADVEKLMVHTSARKQGLASLLMQYLEQLALAHQRRLLVLDTRKGDVAENLYRARNFQLAGEIPGFAANAEGGFDSTLYFYKAL
ncbi:GNAT family N-acetyltransferase [Agaribacterium haliotis]|uniref:GNAT family N-acetyltransferase n=1 Tax=Agaribacterium haliotis TaxID=2013869 RepID=UPI000BB599EA|nr:GNAT family N-acetyltransferase [Agaribacterium haliotis]